MTVKKSLLILLLICALVGVAYYIFNAASTSQTGAEQVTPEHPDSLGFSMSDLEDFVVTEHFGQYFSDAREQNLSAEKGKDIVRIKVISGETKAAAERYATGQFLLLESQYDPRLPPYPEFLTNQTGCEDRFLPERKASADGAFFLLHADERFNYGLCAEDLVRYKAGFGIFYCEPAHTVFQIEYFVPKDRAFSEVEKFMDSFNCTQK